MASYDTWCHVSWGMVLGSSGIPLLGVAGYSLQDIHQDGYLERVSCASPLWGFRRYS